MDRERFLQWQAEFQGTAPRYQIEAIETEVTELKAALAKAQSKNEELSDRLQEGRDFLMMASNPITVEEVFTAFGWNENGF